MKAAGQRLVCRSRSSNEDKASSRCLWHFCSSRGVVSGSMKVDGGRTWGRAFAADDPRWPSCRSAQTNSVFYVRNKNKNPWIVLIDLNPAPSLFSFSLLFLYSSDYNNRLLDSWFEENSRVLQPEHFWIRSVCDITSSLEPIRVQKPAGLRCWGRTVQRRPTVQLFKTELF